MVQKVQQYLSLRSAINNESEQSSNRRRSDIIPAKRNKRNFQTYIDCQDWYPQAKYDVKIQKSIHSIEYVDVATRNSLPLASQNYIKALGKMTKNEKKQR